MKFRLECDEMDGLVFIDKGYLTELDSDVLYAMDILLDPYGETELVFDFPNEDWDTVRLRETKLIKDLCEQGKMIILLCDGADQDCEMEQSNDIADSPKWLHILTGNLLAVTASELIQCLSYPELEIETVFELEVEAGWYAIWNEGIDKIMYCKKEPPKIIPSNIQEI